MKPLELVKTNKLLVGATAVCAVGAAAAGYGTATAAAGSSLYIAANFFSNFFTGIGVNNCGELAKKLRESPNVLINDDLAKATALAIAYGIRTVADKREYHQHKKILYSIADNTEKYWLQIERTPESAGEYAAIEESQLRYAFAANAGELDKIRTLDENTWQQLVTWLAAQHQATLPEDTITAIAHHLYTQFPKNLREVLKQDASEGKQAFSGMLLDLLRESLSLLQDMQQDIQEISLQQQDITAALSLVQTGIEQNAARQEWLLRRLLADKTTATPEPRPEIGNLYGEKISLPQKYVPRLAELEQLKRQILDSANPRLVMTGATPTVGVQGMGGIGKSALAKAVALDEEVRRRFRDGVIWVTLGRSPSLMVRQADIATAIEGIPAGFRDEQEGRVYLKKLLEHRACLLIIDDLWELSHAKAFDILGATGQLLVTTRDARLVEALGAESYRVEVLEVGPALELLAVWARCEVVELPPAAREVARDCGYLPLALKVSGALVGEGTPWGEVLQLLKDKKLEYLQYQDASIYASLAVSWQALSPEYQQNYAQLAVLREDTAIPETALLRLWQQGGTDGIVGRQMLNTLERKALVMVEGKAPNRSIFLHDLQQDFLCLQVKDIAAIHQQLLNAYRHQDGWHYVPNDGYFFPNAAYHFQQAGWVDEWQQLLGDFRWLQAQLEATDVQGVLADFAALPNLTEGLQLVQRALVLSAHILDRDKQQLAAQLLGRLLGLCPPPSQGEKYRYFWEKLPWVGKLLPSSHAPTPNQPSYPEISHILEQAQQWRGAKPWLRPLTPSLTPPTSSLRQTFTHSDSVNAAAITPDGKLVVSGSEDKTVKLWDITTGREVATFSHNDEVSAVAIAPDGKLVVSGSGHGVKLWDITTGGEVATFTHSNWVTAVAITPDGKQVVSGSADKTVKLWDISTGQEVATFSGHHRYVSAVAITPDGKLVVSGSDDSTVKLWDIATRREIATFTGHSREVKVVAITPDGKQVVSGSLDKTVKLWDITTGREVATFSGHSDWVKAVAITPDGKQVVSGSEDKTLKLWDITTEWEVATFSGHSDWVNAVAIAPDGKLVVSGSSDTTVKLWDITTGREVATFSGHSDSVWAVAITPDGKLVVSGSLDTTVKVWDIATGREVATFSEYSDWVNVVAITPDGKLVVSRSSDKTLELWDITKGREIATFSGHSDSVRAVAITPDGKQMVSGSSDNTVKLWDITTGREVATFTHSAPVSAVAITPDGKQVVSGSDDNTVKLWDIATGREVTTFRGHSNWVSAVTITPDGKLVVSGSRDNTVKLWDIATGRVVAEFAADGVISACAVSGDGIVVAGDVLGRLHFLRLEGV